MTDQTVSPHDGPDERSVARSRALGFDVFAIWALTNHGRDVTRLTTPHLSSR